MDENDNTVQPDVQAAPVTGQPAAEDVSTETLDTTDASEPSDASQASDEGTPAAPQADEQLQKFARSQGIELDSPNAIKAAQALQKARSEATRNHQKASELEKATSITQEQLPTDATEQNVYEARLRNMELKNDIQSWKMQNQEKLALESDMVKILADDPNKKLLVQQGYLTLDDVYKLAKASAPDNSDAVRTQASQDTLQRLAHKQQAAVPTGHATTQGTPKEKPFSELSREEMRARLGYAER